MARVRSSSMFFSGWVDKHVPSSVPLIPPKKNNRAKTITSATSQVQLESSVVSPNLATVRRADLPFQN